MFYEDSQISPVTNVPTIAVIIGEGSQLGDLGEQAAQYLLLTQGQIRLVLAVHVNNGPTPTDGGRPEIASIDWHYWENLTTTPVKSNTNGDWPDPDTFVQAVDVDGTQFRAVVKMEDNLVEMVCGRTDILRVSIKHTHHPT